MTIMLLRGGRIIMDDGNPIEGIDLSALELILADPKAGDTITYNGTMWVNAAPRPALYVDEAEGAGSTTILTATYAQIKAAVDASRAVCIRTESSGTYTLTPLATYGGSDNDGYTVTAGNDTYTSETADGALVKQAGGEG